MASEVAGVNYRRGVATGVVPRRRSAVHTSYNRANFDRNRVQVHHRPRTRSITRAELQRIVEAEAETAVQTIEVDEENPDRDRDENQKWEPSVIVGSPLWAEGEDLSPIEIADRKVVQRQLWAAHYQTPYFSGLLGEAVRERDQLDENQENSIPRSQLQSTHQQAITRRIHALESLLPTSTFPPERQNILAAIAGYRAGQIPISDNYTLLYAGHIVDRCPSYSSFTVDRPARMDRYHTIHGPGWLWYEPPLSSSASDIPLRAKKGICLENQPRWRRRTDNMGHYRLVMGFRARQALVARPSLQLYQQTTTPTTPTRKKGKPPTVPDPSAPLVLFNTLLDSGATLPCLYTADLPALLIDPSVYSAQSTRTIATAESVSSMRVYELDVCLYAPSHPPQQILDPTPCPVVIFPSASPQGLSGPDHSPESDTAPDRLSGLLPFHTCFFSSAPGNFKMWMGNGRRDVLGATRFPSLVTMRYLLTQSPQKGDVAGHVGNVTGVLNEEEVGTPDRVIFDHKLPDGRVLRDLDEGAEETDAAAEGGLGEGRNLHATGRAVGGIRVVQTGNFGNVMWEGGPSRRGDESPASPAKSPLTSRKASLRRTSSRIKRESVK